MEFVVCIVSALGFYFILKFAILYIRWRFSPLWKLPGPKRETWMFGQFFTIQKEPFMSPQNRWWKEAGIEIPLIHYCQAAGNHSVFVLDPDIVKQILVAKYGKHPQYKKNLVIIRKILGKGLITLEGTDWQRHRRVCNPSFQPKLIQESLEDAVPVAMKKIISYWKQAESRDIDISKHLSNLTLDVIGKVAFAHEFHALESIRHWAEQTDTTNNGNLMPVSDKLFLSMTDMIRNMPRAILFKMFNLSAFDFSTKKSMTTLNDATDTVINAARKKNEHRNSHSPPSLLQKLFDAKDTKEVTNVSRRLSSEELRDEVKTFILAGHETTSAWCYWAIFSLCKYPDVQEKVYKDVLKHAKDGEINLESIENMEYFNAFTKEVLRMFPPIGMILRHTVEETQLKGTTIPAKTRIMIPIHLLHRHPLYWEDPDSFKPERWLNDEKPYKHSHAYLPFSAGPRNCIGSSFAKMEAKLILAPLVREFHFQLHANQIDTKFTFTTFIIMKAKPDVKVCIRSRR